MTKTGCLFRLERFIVSVYPIRWRICSCISLWRVQWKQSTLAPSKQTDGVLCSSHFITVRFQRGQNETKEVVLHLVSFWGRGSTSPCPLISMFSIFFTNDFVPVQRVPYLPTPPLGQDMAQGQFLSGV